MKALFVVAFILIALVRVRRPTSLPALPPRPPSRNALRSKASASDTRRFDAQGSNFANRTNVPDASHDTSPFQSTRSRFRMRPSNTSTDADLSQSK